jgi:hypothetical protein
LNDGECTVAGRKTVQPNGLIRLAGFCHGDRNTRSHKPLAEASWGTNDSAARHVGRKLG